MLLMIEPTRLHLAPFAPNRHERVIEAKPLLVRVSCHVGVAQRRFSTAHIVSLQMVLVLHQ